jgi:hypothetical protein
MLRGTQTNVELEYLPCVILVVTGGCCRASLLAASSSSPEVPQDGDNGSILAVADSCMRILYAAAISRPSRTVSTLVIVSIELGHMRPMP